MPEFSGALDYRAAAFPPGSHEVTPHALYACPGWEGAIQVQLCATFVLARRAGIGYLGYALGLVL